MDMPLNYTRPQLKILWYLKTNGPLSNPGPYTPGAKEGIINTLAIATDLTKGSLSYNLKVLEDNCFVLRTYLRNEFKGAKFETKVGYNPLVKLELVDPHMWLPELTPIPPKVQIMRDNEELYERTATEPAMERVLSAVLDRNDELQSQIDKLHKMVQDLSDENESLKHKYEEMKRPPRTHMSDHLTHRAQDALPPEVWERLRHQESRITER